MPRWLALFEEMGKADPNAEGRELVAASEAKVVRVVDGERVVTDGPFAETKEQIGGLFVTDAARPRRGDPHRRPRPGSGVRLDGDQAYRGAVTVSLEATFREEWPRAVAILTRVLGDLTLAEDAVQDAFATALERWPRDGVPRSPGAWIVATARNGAIDRIRRDRTFARKAELLARLEELPSEEDADVSSIPDERLALLFTCCHPALRGRGAGRADAARGRAGSGRPRSPARSSSPEPTLAQRLVRAKRRVRETGIPFRVPPTTCSPTACPTSSASSTSSSTRAMRRRAGDELVRRELCAEAIRLAKLLCVLMPDEPEAFGLLALLLLQDSRRDARSGTRRRARAARRSGPGAVGPGGDRRGARVS